MAPDARPGTQYRLVALDIDGTILTSAQEVTDELKACLARLAGASVRTVLCTGRRWQTTVPVLGELAHVHPVVVCCGGALIKEADSERTLRRAPMQHGTARRAALLFRQGGLVPMLLYDRPVGTPDMRVSEADRQRAAGLPYVRANPGCWEYYPGDYPEGDESPLLIFALTRGHQIAQAEAGVRQALGRDATMQIMRQARYGADQVTLELHDPAATKWSALQWLLGRWGIGPDEVVAIGDDVNDLPMLRAAGLSFAMGNAPDDVKASADAITAPNDEHGVVEALASVFDL